MEQGTDGNESAVKAFGRRHHIPVASAAKLTDLIELLEERPHVHPKAAEVLPLIRAYRQQYGAS